VLNYAHHKDRKVDGGITPHFLTSALNRSKCFASHPGEITTNDYCVGSWAGPRARINAMKSSKISYPCMSLKSYY
jgi:hypothetical protein